MKSANNLITFSLTHFPIALKNKNAVSTVVIIKGLTMKMRIPIYPDIVVSLFHVNIFKRSNKWVSIN